MQLSRALEYKLLLSVLFLGQVLATYYRRRPYLAGTRHYLLTLSTCCLC